MPRGSSFGNHLRDKSWNDENNPLSIDLLETPETNMQSEKKFKIIDVLHDYGNNQYILLQMTHI